MQTPKLELYRELAAYVSAIPGATESILTERRARLERLAGFVRERTQAGGVAELVFICTHNSRRSQLTQIWARTAAHVWGVAGVECFSGGTVATTLNRRAVAAVERAGFRIHACSGGPNPRYVVRFSEHVGPVVCFSKLSDSPDNPKRGFAAVMNCSAADAACPMVAGATLRISLPFEDPGDFDGTPLEQQKYDDCCRLIARDMLYTMSLVAP